MDGIFLGLNRVCNKGKMEGRRDLRCSVGPPGREMRLQSARYIKSGQHQDAPPLGLSTFPVRFSVRRLLIGR